MTNIINKNDKNGAECYNLIMSKSKKEAYFMIIKDIDVSKWNGDVDFAKVKADGIKFVMLREGLERSAS